MKKGIHICFVIYDFLDGIDDFNGFLDEIYSLTGWAEALHQQGCKISAILRFSKHGRVIRNGVEYNFFTDQYGVNLKFWQVPKQFHYRVGESNADVFHGHNFNKILQHRHLLRHIKAPLVIQNHAETPKIWVRQKLQKLVFKEIEQFLFTAPGQEKNWVERGIIQKDKVKFIMEASVDFTVAPRQSAQEKTGISGNPIFLWVGNLNQNKDPLTILEAFRRIHEEHTTSRLYMIYRFDDIIDEVKAFLEKNPDLLSVVHLLGKKDRANLPDFYNSANYFLLGSHQEGSGYAALEAMACGCVPIITNIPSFRKMTGNGRVGALWPCDDVDQLEQKIRKAMQKNWEDESQKVLQYFNDHWSYQALASRMIGYYSELL